MKLGNVVKAGLLVGALASSASAQSLTGSMTGSGGGASYSTPGPNVAAVPNCIFPNICQYSFVFGSPTNGLNYLSVSGEAEQLMNGDMFFNFNYVGALRLNSVNADVPITFQFKAPIFTTGFQFIQGSSSFGYNLTRKLLGTSAQTNNSLDVDLLGGNSTVLDLVVPNKNLTSFGGTVTDAAIANSGILNIGNSALSELVVKISFDLKSSNGNSTDFNGSGAVNLFTHSTVPEPSTYALMGMGLAGVLVAARRRRSV